jgi:hypothetical protein
MPKATADLTLIITTLHNLPLAEIVDQLGLVKVGAAEIEARERTLKAELAVRGVTSADGALFQVNVTTASRWTIDTSRVREEMGESWVVARSKVASVTSVRVTARTDVAAQAVAQSTQVAA